MNEFYSHKPNTYSYREVNNNIQHIKFCTLTFIAIFINLHNVSNTITLHEEINSLNLNVMILLQQ
jgi:hypothetical protein